MRIIGSIRNHFKRANFVRQKAEFRKLERNEWRSAVRDIAPSNLDVKPNYVICDDTILTLIVAGITRHGERGFPEKLTKSVLKELMDINVGNYTIGITTAVMKIPNIEASHMIYAAEMSNIGNQYVERESNKSGYVSADTRADLKDVNSKAEKIQSQSERLFSRAFVISILAETQEDTNLAIGHVTQILGAKLIRYEIPTGKMGDALKTALPFPFMPRWAEEDTLSEDTAKFLAAQNNNPTSDDVGLRLGHKKGNPSQTITVDFKKLPAFHLLATGQTGSGKSTALLIWLLRWYSELHGTCFFITAKKDTGTDHRRIIDSVGADGIVIDIGPGKHSINPLQIVYDESQVGDTPYEWVSVVHRHINLITRFFAVFLEEGMTAPKKSYINESLVRLYAEYGIHIDRPETLKETLRTTKYPHMNDLIALWKQDQKVCGQGDRGKTIASMINNTFQLDTTGALGHINRDSDVFGDAINNKFIAIDVSAVDDDLREAMNVFVTGMIYQKFRSTKNTGVPTVIVIDEAGSFFRNPTTRNEIVKQLTQSRSDNVAMWFGTQQLYDIENAGIADVVKNNVFINVAFGPGGDSSKVDLVSGYYHFNEFEETAWINCDQGEAMIMIKGAKVPVKIKLTPYELSVIKGTNFGDKDTTLNQSPAIENPINPLVRKLVDENGICVSSWLLEEHEKHVEDYFTELRWTSQTCTSATGAGRLKVWVRPGLIRNAKVGAQSEDHYFTVLQIAGYLLARGISRTTVHHTDNVDVSTSIDEKFVAFEFEKPGSHTSDQLLGKQKRAEEDHDICYFVGTRENIALLKSSVTSQNVIQRGINLKRLLDVLIEETL